MRPMPADPQRRRDPPRAFRPATPVVIGITGGVAAGKTAVAAMFAARGLRHVDADAHARLATAEPAVLLALAAEFGPAVIRDGALDRAAMAQLAFADPAAR